MYASMDENLWGIGYKVVMRRQKYLRPPATTYSAKLQSSIENLFPWRAEMIYSVQDMGSPEEIPEISEQELDSACR